MTRDQAKETFATALRLVTADRIGGLPPIRDLAPDIESWPLTRLGGEKPLTIFEWFEVYRMCFNDMTTYVVFAHHDRGPDTTVGDLLTAMQEATVTHHIEIRPEMRGA